MATSKQKEVRKEKCFNGFCMKYLYLFLSALLLLCLAPMPYGYYILIRYVSMVVFGFMAYRYVKENKVTLAVIFGTLALLFQPFFKIALGRTMWNIVDVLVAILLIVICIRERNNTTKRG